MKSQIPTAMTPLLASTQSAIAGCSALEASLGLMHTTGATISAALKKFEKSQTDFKKADSKLSAANKAIQSLDDKAYELIQTAARGFKKFLGNQYSQSWDPTGFPNNSTAVPDSADARMVLVHDLELYLTDHPEHENEKQEVTAEIAGKLYEDILAARANVTTADANQDAAKEDRDQAKNDLRKTLQNLADELDLLLSDNDPRWKKFGFEIPAERHTPDAPANLVVDNGLPGKLLVTCGPSPGADHYRFWLQEKDSKAEPVAVGSSQEPQIVIDDVEASKAFKIFTSVVNGAGKESKLSEPVEAIVKAVAV